MGFGGGGGGLREFGAARPLGLLGLGVQGLGVMEAKGRKI